MEFGKLPYEELNAIDFTLPSDPPRNKKILPGSKEPNPKVYLGMPKWGRPEWVGTLYPKGTKEKTFLTYYVDHFNAIELNATHYNLYNAVKIADWVSFAGDRDFKFCPKFYKGITHVGSLKGKQGIVDSFIEGIEGFGKHLGPALIQVSDSFSTKRKTELFEFLKALPAHLQYFLEIRHPSWYESQEIFDFLQANNIGAVITDTEGRRDCVQMNLTLPKTFIRLVLNDHVTDEKRIVEWAKRIDHWLDKGLEEVYFFVHSRAGTAGLLGAQFAIEKFNEICNAGLKPLKLQQKK